MARLLKPWESPRREGRNDKGRGGSARQRQLKKQQQMLRRKLKEQSENQNKNKSKGGNESSLPYLFLSIHCIQHRRNRTITALPNFYRAVKSPSC